MQDELIDACEAGNIQLVSQILRKHPGIVNTSTLDVPGWITVLHAAAENGNLTLCEALLAFGADINKPASASGYTTPLVEAAEAGHLDVVKFLCGAGAFVDGVDESSMSPLLAAVDSGHHQIAKYLISNGADVNRIDRIRRYYALDFANRREDNKLENLLRKNSGISTQSDVDFEARPGYPVISYVSNYAGPVYPAPFFRSPYGVETIFHIAAIDESKRKLILLFSSGAYIDAQNVDVNVVLPFDWPILQNYRNQPSVLSFPLDFLAAVAGIARSARKIEHGTILFPDDPEVVGCAWPKEIFGMVAIDFSWPRTRDLSEGDGAANDESVDLLTFAPIIGTPKAINSEKGRLAWCERKKRGTWKANSFPDWKKLTS